MNKKNYENQNELNNKLIDDRDFCLTDRDFYPSLDNRTFKSLIYDISIDNNFVDYTKYIFDLYESEDYYEN